MRMRMRRCIDCVDPIVTACIRLGPVGGYTRSCKDGRRLCLGVEAQVACHYLYTR